MGSLFPGAPVERLIRDAELGERHPSIAPSKCRFPVHDILDRFPCYITHQCVTIMPPDTVPLSAIPTTIKKAVCLLSGGLDSTTALAIARERGLRRLRHVLPLRPAPQGRARVRGARVAALGVKHHVIVDIDLRQFGGSALTSDIAVPKSRAPRR
jgi:hypothetical protein